MPAAYLAQSISKDEEAGSCTHYVLLVAHFLILVRQLKERKQREQPHAAQQKTGSGGREGVGERKKRSDGILNP